MKLHENLFSGYGVITPVQTEVANIVAPFFFFLECAKKWYFRETNIRGRVK